MSDDSTALKVLNPDEPLEIPPEVAVCPYCDTKLTAQFDSLTQEPDGTWAADHVMLDCETEPAIESDEWEDWFRWHSDMPYVYMLPVVETVLAWINKNYRFNLERTS